MKTTIDLPDSLLKAVKLRALHDGRKLKDEVADLLRKGLAIPATELPPAMIVTDKQTGLPMIRGGRPAARGREATPDRVAEILLEQEVEAARAARR